jgi:hypothetical protein
MFWKKEKKSMSETNNNSGRAVVQVRSGDAPKPRVDEERSMLVLRNPFGCVLKAGVTWRVNTGVSVGAPTMLFSMADRGYEVLNKNTVIQPNTEIVMEYKVGSADVFLEDGDSLVEVAVFGVPQLVVV